MLTQSELKELKTKWIAALRSGDYIQTQEFLHDTENNYCCIGVLADQIDAEYLKSSKVKWLEDDLVGSKSFVWEYDGFPHYENKEMPESIRNLINLSEAFHSKLIDMNDQDESSFNEIADYIERHQDLMTEL